MPSRSGEAPASGPDVPGSTRSALGRKLLLLVASLFVSALIVELLLQAASMLYRRARLERAATTMHASVEGEYRVLCLGESMTRGFGQTPYPEILETRLNEGNFGPSFTVHNAGFTAAHSSRLVRALPKLLENTKPDMVIVMMGINDQFYFSDTAGLDIPVDVQLVLLKSRLYKLLRLMWFNLGIEIWDRRSARESESPPDAGFAEFKQAFWSAQKKWRERQLEDPGRVFAEFIREARSSADPAASKVGATIAISPRYLRLYYNVYLNLAEFYLESGAPEKAIELYREAITTHPDAEFFYRGLSGVYDRVGKHELSEEYRARSQELAGTNVLAVTRDSYRRLHAILRQSGVEFAAMQYPLRKLGKLRFLLGDAEDPTYVDNERVFRQALETSSYDELFIDRFAGDFGHCSERGNWLIVENLIATVFRPMFVDDRGPGTF